VPSSERILSILTVAVKCRLIRRQYAACHKLSPAPGARTQRRANYYGIRHKAPDIDWIILARQIKEKAVKDKSSTAFV